MNAEYQRLEAEASEVEGQMRILSTTVDMSSASSRAKFERQISDLGRKLASLHHGMALIQATDSSEMRRRERQFVKALPKKLHSQGIRKKAIQLPGQVTASLSVTYYHHYQSLSPLPIGWDRSSRAFSDADAVGNCGPRYSEHETTHCQSSGTVGFLR